MTDELNARTAVKIALAQRDMSLTNLAAKLGTHKSTLSRVVNDEQAINARSLWPRVFAELGIEVVFRTK